MSNYASTPFEPIVQGTVTFTPAVPGPSEPVFEGTGLEAIARFPGHPLGAYILTLDQGLPGNSGAVPPGAGALLNPDVRTLITCRAPPLPAVNPIQTISVLYLPLIPNPAVGCTTLLVVMADNTNSLNDPIGFEIAVFRVFNG
jgi:hypothetical protein